MKNYTFSCGCFISRSHLIHLLTYVLLYLVLPSKAYSQDNEFDEVILLLNVQKVGSVDLPALLIKEEAYIPIKELFDFIKVKNIPSLTFDSLSGFFIKPSSSFLIDASRKQIRYEGKIHDLSSSELFRKGSNIYVKCQILQDVFGLFSHFNIRSLSITLSSKIDLPATTERQQELIRKNLAVLTGEKEADTIIERKFSMFHLGVADWSVTATQERLGVSTRANVRLGANIAGGEAEVNLNYYNTRKYSNKEHFFRWKWVNNDFVLLRQLSLGRIYPSSISSIYNAVTGIQFTNATSSGKKSMGSYRFISKTEPDWTVELYLNNVLVNYVKADASGFFSFDIPLMYGASSIRLRCYGPWGEEILREQNLVIPFNFVPVGTFEYNFSAGFLNHDISRRFSRFNGAFGVSTRLTIGGGAEYFASEADNKVVPFINASVRLYSNIIVSAEHFQAVMDKYAFNYKPGNNVQLDLQYIKYQRGQTVIRQNYHEEKKLSLSFPLRMKKAFGFTRFTLNRFSTAKHQLTKGELLLSMSRSRVSVNLNTHVHYSDIDYLTLNSNLSTTFRLPARIRITSQLEYNLIGKTINGVRAEFEKSLFRNSVLHFSYEKNKITKTTSFSLGARVNFSFLQTSLSVRNGNDGISSVQSARGSLIYKEHDNTLTITEQNSAGKGGVIIVPFLDLNFNNRRDKNEPGVAGLKINMNGGRIRNNMKDTSIQVQGLEGFSTYLIEVDKSSLDNIAWKLSKQSFRLTVEPNYHRRIEVPIVVMGEVSGNVLVKDSRGNRGLSRVMIHIYQNDSVLVASTLSEGDGYFNYLGLAPGRYTASIDAQQLKTLHMTSTGISFTIKEDKNGDVAGNVELIAVPH